jgi:hypothetical protein
MGYEWWIMSYELTISEWDDVYLDDIFFENGIESPPRGGI